MGWERVGESGAFHVLPGSIGVIKISRRESVCALPTAWMFLKSFYCIVRRIVWWPQSGQAPVSSYTTRPSRYWSILPSFRRRRIAKHSCVSVNPQILSSSLNVYRQPDRIRLESVLLFVMIESMSVYVRCVG